MRGGYLMVPRNRQGMIEQMQGTESEENILFVALTGAEREALQPLLHAFERAFGFDSQGQAVEQLIDTRNAVQAAAIAHLFVQQAEASPNGALAASAAGKMHTALEAALEYGSYVELAF